MAKCSRLGESVPPPAGPPSERSERGSGAALAQWLKPAFGDVRLEVDTDELPALAADRALRWQQVTAAPFLTINEKRAMTGFGPLEGGDRM
jgi:phage portal protein BeeE